MKILGVIPARYASSRLPGKPLEEIDGKPMIQWVYEACQKAGIFSHLTVATDDDRIDKAVRKFGGQATMTSSTHRNGSERVSEVLAVIQDSFDIVINVQGDEPFLDPDHLLALAKAFRNPDVNIASLYRVSDDIELWKMDSVVKLVTDEADKALYFSRSPIPYSDRDIPQHFKKHIGLYAFRAELLPDLVSLPPCELEIAEKLEQLRWLYHGHDIQMVEVSGESLSVDTPEDLERAQQIAKGKI